MQYEMIENNDVKYNIKLFLDMICCFIISDFSCENILFDVVG